MTGMSSILHFREHDDEILSIQGLQEIIDLKEIYDYFIWKMPGDKLLREDINLEYIAFLFASYDDVEKNKD